MDVLPVSKDGYAQIREEASLETSQKSDGPASHATHEVVNQPPPLVGLNIFEQDQALVEGIRREQAGWSEEQLRLVGQVAGSATATQLGIDANASVPVLQTYDRYGHRVDEVVYHPAWHQLMEKAVSWGLHASAWRDSRPGAQVARAAAFYLWSQVEAGHGCPISMTFASIPALKLQPDLATEWVPRLTSLEYDPGLRSVVEKRGALCGMAMTEKQGGSDVRANTSFAAPVGAGGPGEEYRLTGHKWFCSAPMCDVFLVLAQARRPGGEREGLSCFLLPRVLPSGARNHISIMRLKDKLGNRSNASAELEFDQAYALMLGEEGRGVRTILEMVNCTRLDCIIGTAAVMRQALAQASHHAAYRRAFGRSLIDQPLMQNVLADLSLESEAATVLMLRLARAADGAARSEPHEVYLKRLGTAIGKYWVCKRGSMHTAEALECLGGNGYVEDSLMPRLYREAPLNSIWEGAGNVNCLDVYRAMAKEPETVEAYFTEVRKARGANLYLDQAISTLERECSAAAADGERATEAEGQARRLVERLAITLQAALLVQHAPSTVADAFSASRLGGDWGHAFGTLPPAVDYKAIIDRTRPRLPAETA
jgi:putative acyl-CoA dehydrogenase